MSSAYLISYDIYNFDKCLRKMKKMKIKLENIKEALKHKSDALKKNIKVLSAKIANKIKKHDSAEKNAELELDGVEIIEDDGKILHKKPLKRWKKVLIIAGSSIAGIIVIVAVTFVLLRISGKNSIYNKAEVDRPNLNKTEKESNENGETIGQIDIETDENGEIIIIGENTGNSSENNTGNNNDSLQTDKGENSSDKKHEISFEGAGTEAGYDLIYDGVRYVYNKDMITMLFLGIDKLGSVEPAPDFTSGGQSDAIFMLIMNPHTMVMDIIAIPRDTIALVDVYNKDGSYNLTGYTQICLQHAFGDGMSLSNERTKKAVSKMLFDLPIHSVSSFNMGAIQYLNDAVGGVRLEVLHDVDMQGGYQLKAGETVTLKGMYAYAYVRYRDCNRHYTAEERLARQKQYITLFLKKAISEIKNDIGIVMDVYDIVSEYVVTDLSVDEMVYLASELISYDFGQIYSLKGTVNTNYKYERLYLDEEALYDLIIQKFYEKVE